MRTAIELWFSDSDPVPIYALAYAAYEVIHVVSKATRKHELLFDLPFLKAEYRNEWALALKQPANFFKHANKDPNPRASIQFKPATNELFIFFSILGIEAMSEPLNEAESIFMLWFKVHRSPFLSEEGQKLLAESVPVEDLAVVRKIPKQYFFEAVQRMLRDPETGVSIPR